MYTRPVRRRDSLGLAGIHARQIPADRHDGPYTEYLRRHEIEAKQASLGSRRNREQFARSLLHRAGDSRNTMLAVEHCASRGQAAGPNGLKPSDLDTTDCWNLAKELGKAIQNGTYRTSKTRTEWINKGTGRGQRPIRIQNFEDRCAERAVLQVIRPMTEQQYLDNSMGFRNPGPSREEALAKAERLAHDLNRWTWISEDIKDAFEHIPCNRLMQVARRMIPADSICDFIGRLATKHGGRGVRQGGPLSPELLNIYLHWMLDRWWQGTYPEVPLLRVADDLLVLSSSEDASRLHGQLNQRMTTVGMPLKGTPWTAVRDLAAGQCVDWLGYRVRRHDEGMGVSISDRSWDKLEDHLRLAWEEPSPPLAANEAIRGWIGQQGAAYKQVDVEEAYRGITERAAAEGFLEIPSREELASRWYGAYRRDWVRHRREVLLQARRGDSGLADGYADQHGIFATIQRRSDVACPTGVPPQYAPIRREVCLYCDGSCLGPRGVGGWAYVLVESETGYRRELADSHLRTTNNRMELTAVIKGLEALDSPSNVTVVTDSEYVYYGITERLPRWKKNRWRRTGGALANLRLWQRLDRLIERHFVCCRWVRGHGGDPVHDQCDVMARAAAYAVVDSLSAPRGGQT